MSFLNRFLDRKPQDDTLRSVVRNLTHLLNSKRGYGSPLCSFGLSDYYAQQGARAAALSVMKEVLRDVAEYEPRLRAVDVLLLRDGQLPFFFEVRGELRVDRGRPLAPDIRPMPCRLGILFDPLHGSVVIEPIEVDDVR
jgi:type VI secretion system lysozyme-like protein